MKLVVTNPRPTVLTCEAFGLMTVVASSLLLGASEQVLAIAAGWAGGLLHRLLEILKDKPDDEPVFRVNIVAGSFGACVLMVLLCWQYREHVSVLVPVMTAFSALFGSVILKLISDENLLTEGFKASGGASGGCRYPEGGS